MEDERLISPELEDIQEERVENSLRPKNFRRIHWTRQSKKQYENIHRGCQEKRGEPLDHVFIIWTSRLRKNNACKHNIKRNELKYKNNIWPSNRKARRFSSTINKPFQNLMFYL